MPSEARPARIEVKSAASVQKKTPDEIEVSLPDSRLVFSIRKAIDDNTKVEGHHREYPQITANASQIPWQLDNDMSAMLPVMQTDIMLTYGPKVLIIDAKYYAHTTQIQFDKHTLHSSNLYQIFTYVKNKEVELADQPHVVSGMLLYAKTDEDIYPENEYLMSGNRIEVRTLNLDGDFEAIRAQLNSIAEKYLGI